MFAMPVLLVACLPALATSAKPHVFFLLVDDYGWAGAGWHNGVETAGQREVQTPHMDKLVLEGINLNQAYAPPLPHQALGAFKKKNGAKSGVEVFFWAQHLVGCWGQNTSRTQDKEVSPHCICICRYESYTFKQEESYIIYNFPPGSSSLSCICRYTFKFFILYSFFFPQVHVQVLLPDAVQPAVRPGNL